uniref:CCR4-Not complex component Not1 C-terminal domain-containing protein n=1 Tax=Physcomitrium patens TaxID=3218 RepID=A0A7I4E1I6_PHYPA
MRCLSFLKRGLPGSRQIKFSYILLRNCLEQVNLAENDQNLQVKLDLLALVLRNLIHQPNSGTVLCEALRNLPCVSEEFFANLCRALKLSLPEQIALGIALADAEDISQRQQGCRQGSGVLKNPSLNWSLIVSRLDYEGFYLPDENAFILFMTMYKLGCEDPFPIDAICGHVWRNDEGQLSFLRHAILSAPEVFSFVHSTRKLMETSERKLKSPNYAWLSLDLVEVLCRLAETEHVDEIREILEFPRHHCPELLALSLVQINSDVSLKGSQQSFQEEMLSRILGPLFSQVTLSAEGETLDPLWSKLWALNPEILKMEMVNLLFSKDHSVYDQVLQMFSFAIQALDSFRERLSEWPEFIYHILKVRHIHEAQNDILDYIMNIVKENQAVDPSTAVNDSNVCSVVARPIIVKAPTSLLQDTQVGVRNLKSAVDFVYPAGNRFSGSQSRYLSGQGLDSFLQISARSFSSTAEAQSQNSTQSVPQASLDSLLSLQSGFGTNSQSPFQPIFRATSVTPTQYQPSQPSAEETANNVMSDAQAKQSAITPSSQPSRTTETVVSSQHSSAEATSLSAAARDFPFSAASNGHTANQAHIRTGTRSGNASGSFRIAISGFGHALNIETLVAGAGKRDKPIEAPSSEIQDKVAFIINNISWTNLEAKAEECAEILEEYYPWFAQYVVMKRASIEPNNHDTYIKFLDKMDSKELHKEVLRTTYENCKVLFASNLIKTHSEERSLLKNLGSWLGKLTIRRNQALRARELDPKSLIIKAYQKGLMIAIIPFTSKVLESCNQSLAYQPPNPWTMAILSLLVEIYNLPNLKMNLMFDIEVLFKNLNVDVREVKHSKLLEGLEREVEGNPDFSNKDPIFSQSPSPALSASSSAPTVPVPSLPQQLDMPPELPSVIQPATSLTSSVIAQLIGEERPSLALERAQNVQASSTPSQPSFPSTQASMAIPDLTSYVVLNAKLAGLGQHLQLARVVPVAMERAIREIISPVVDRSVTIACTTTRELVMKKIRNYAMESDENRTNQSANLMVASLAGSLAHVTCKEPLRVAMANYLRTFLQTALAQDVLEQAVNLVTNDNLDLGCAVIEKSATEKAQRDLEEVIAPAFAQRRADRIRTGSAYHDNYMFTNQTLSNLPETLRPRPGQLSITQARVYGDFARFPWQNQSSHAPVTMAGPPGITNLSGRGIYSVPGRDPGANSRASLNGNQSSSVLGATAQVSDPSSDEMDITEPSPLSFSSMACAGGADAQARLSQETSLSFPIHSNSSTPPPEFNVVETPSASKGMLGSTPSSTPPLPADYVGSTAQEPSLTTGEALEKFSVVAQKALANEVPEIILQCVSRDEAASAIAQMVFKRLYDNTTSQIHVLVHLNILESIRDVCRRVVKELTSWVVYSDEDRKFNREITVGFIRSELINLTDYGLHLTKCIDGGRNNDAVSFAAYLVKTCVIEEAGVTSTEFYNVIEALGKLAARPGTPESLQELVEIAKGTPSTNKDDKGRLSKEKKELAESHCLNSETSHPVTVGSESRLQEGSNMSFAAIDMVAKLVVLLVKYSSEPSLNKVNLLTRVLNVTVRTMKRDHDRKAGFHPRPYFRLFVTWLMHFNLTDSTLDSSNYQVLQAFGYAFLTLRPLDVPGFSLAWLELISHRTFMPKLLLSNAQKGWSLFQKLLVALFKFMEPYLRNANLSEPVRLLYKGMLRVLLVLLHDFPEFLCEHHFSFCDVISPSCIQMRNLILSAFPRNMRLPDPFTPNLKVDLLPEISHSPRILSDVETALKSKQLKSEVDDFIKNRNQQTLTSMDLKVRLTLLPQEAQASGTRYNVPLLNALVLYVGMQAIQQLHSKTSQQVAALTAPITHSAPMDIFELLVNDLDTEGRYLFLNAVANQLRYPNNHTYYFSCVLLFLSAEALVDIVQEQITRVLLERLIVNRPHPWGLLITFIESSSRIHVTAFGHTALHVLQRLKSYLSQWLDHV